MLKNSKEDLLERLDNYTRKKIMRNLICCSVLKLSK